VAILVIIITFITACGVFDLRRRIVVIFFLSLAIHCAERIDAMRKGRIALSILEAEKIEGPQSVQGGKEVPRPTA